MAGCDLSVKTYDGDNSRLPSNLRAVSYSSLPGWRDDFSVMQVGGSEGKVVWIVNDFVFADEVDGDACGQSLRKQFIERHIVVPL